MTTINQLEEARIIEAGADHDQLMIMAGLDPAMGFEALAIQTDRTLIVCDKCGNFGYISKEDM